MQAYALLPGQGLHCLQRSLQHLLRMQQSRLRGPGQAHRLGAGALSGRNFGGGFRRVQAPVSFPENAGQGVAQFLQPPVVGGPAQPQSLAGVDLARIAHIAVLEELVGEPLGAIWRCFRFGVQHFDGFMDRLPQALGARHAWQSRRRLQIKAREWIGLQTARVEQIAQGLVDVPGKFRSCEHGFLLEPLRRTEIS